MCDCCLDTEAGFHSEGGESDTEEHIDTTHDRRADRNRGDDSDSDWTELALSSAHSFDSIVDSPDKAPPSDQ